MFEMPTRRSVVLLLAMALPSALARTAYADACDEGSVLRGHPVLVSGEALGRVEVVTDGWLVPEGRPSTLADSVRLASGARLRVVLDRPALVSAVYLQGDAAATFVLEGAGADGRFEPLFDARPVDGSGERGRGATFAPRALKALRVTVQTTSAYATLSEVGVFTCDRALADAARWTRTVPDPDLGKARTDCIGWAKVAFGLLALFLLVWASPRLTQGRARALYLALCLASCVAWLDFGGFTSIARGPLHLWDSVHYFLGSKYAHEVGYTNLYPCLGASAQRRGRAEIFERGVMRRLDDNVRVPGTAIRRAAMRCTTFSPERAREFDADIAAIGQLPLPYGMPPEAFANDRGYMATPFGSAFDGLFTANARPSLTFFRVFAVIDALCLALAIGVIALGIGLRPAAFVAVGIGVGAPWDYYWLGGAFDRHTWLLAFAGAIVAIHRRYSGLAGVLLTFIVLHRVFPVGFALGALAFALRSRGYDEGAPRLDGRRMLVAFGVAMSVGVVVGGFAGGFDSWLAFVGRVQVHASTPVANEFGLRAALRLLGGSLDAAFDPGQLDGLVPWQARIHALDVARAPLRWVLTAGALGLVVHAYRSRRPAIEGAFAVAMLFCCLTNVASYYSGFVLFLASVPTFTERIRVGVITAAILTQILVLLPIGDGVDTYALISAALLIILAGGFVIESRGVRLDGAGVR